jgi:tetratricopeptide (TPR) repeat protein
MLLGLAVWGSIATAQPVANIAHWQTRYAALLPKDDARAAQAHSIFERVVQAAGRHSGVVPRLLIIKSDPWGISLPIALPDGWIVLSKGVLDICYRDPIRGDDRLAFVLGHEIAHQLKDDFWHLKFFQALEAAKTQHPQQRTALQEVAGFIRAPQEERPAQELRADEHGIIYAAMAGFNPQAIVTADGHSNFFQDWLQARTPQRLGLGLAASSHPTPDQRTASVRAQLRQVVDKTALFDAGLWWHYAGDYAKAIRAFEQFLTFFPSREVYHNLATSHHQLALQAYQAWQKDTPVLPFALSLALDPLTRANDMYLSRRAKPERGSGTAAKPVELFRSHLDEAIRFYREAITHDAAYTPAAVNLGCALLVRGVRGDSGLRHADVYEAVATLQRALERQPNVPEILNNLGVALFYVERPQQATEHFIRARSLAPAYAAPVFNLAQIAQAERREADAQRLRHDYAQLAPQAPAQAPPAGQVPEQVTDLKIGDLEEHIPPSWGKPTQSTFQLETRVLTLATYAIAARTLSQDGELLMIVVQEGYRGTSARGIAIGSSPQDVQARYGPPSRRLETTQGQSWSYDAQRIAVQLRGGRVVSWLLF